LRAREGHRTAVASRDGAAVRMDYAGRMRQGVEKGSVAQPPRHTPLGL